MKTKVVKLPMFRTSVVLVAGKPREIKNAVESIIARCGVKLRGNNPLKKDAALKFSSRIGGKAIRLVPDRENQNCIDTTIICICVNEGSEVFTKNKFISREENLIEVVSHEIRHAVDYIGECRFSDELETPAYLTGYLTRELLPVVL